MMMFMITAKPAQLHDVYSIPINYCTDLTVIFKSITDLTKVIRQTASFTERIAFFKSVL